VILNMKKSLIQSLQLLLTASMVFGLSGCATAPVALKHSPEFAPVLPVMAERPREATGSIYSGRPNDNFFGRSRNFRVGDLITVKLREESDATRKQEGLVGRKSSNTAIPEGLTRRARELSLPTRILGTTLGGVLGGVNLNEADVKSEGKSNATQGATMSGDVTVTVVEVLANGNLMVRGEKQLAFTEGAEVYQISGIVRPNDVSPNNIVESKRLANAQISYRGTGDMANAYKPGWGTSALLKLWPF
jgi:flagellar L-ring protein precursor FlgH